jgi:hypothetical protein
MICESIAILLAFICINNMETIHYNFISCRQSEYILILLGVYSKEAQLTVLCFCKALYDCSRVCLLLFTKESRTGVEVSNEQVVIQ